MADHPGDRRERTERSPADGTPRILVTGGNATTRNGLSLLLERAEPRFHVAAAMDLTPDLPDRAREIAPDLVVVDARLPDLTAVSASRGINDRLTGARVVLLTAQADSRAVAACAIAGAGHVVKSLDGAALAAALLRLHQSHRHLDTRIAAALLDWYTNRPAGDTRAQARRSQESEVLAQVLNGSADREIALQIGVDSITVRSEIVHLYSVLSEDPEFRPIGTFLSRWLG